MKTTLKNNATNGVSTNNGWLPLPPGYRQGRSGHRRAIPDARRYSNYTDAEVNANFTVVKPDAGIRWYLEWLKTQYGAWVRRHR